MKEFADYSKWIDSPWLNSSSSKPTYDDFKGKLVFMKKTSNQEDVQEQNEWQDISVQDKWKAVWNHAKNAIGRADNNLYVNYLSAAGNWGTYGNSGTYTPAMFAYYVNKRAHDNVIQNKWKPGSEFPLALASRPPQTRLSASI